MFHLAVLCDSLRCGAYGSFCYGISCIAITIVYDQTLTDRSSEVSPQHSTKQSSSTQHGHPKAWVTAGEEQSSGGQHSSQQAQVDGILARQVEGLAVQNALELAKSYSLMQQRTKGWSEHRCASFKINRSRKRMHATLHCGVMLTLVDAASHTEPWLVLL